jgi:transcription initiation factor TFIIIB Brf1 subunit/transcription initiation factor TFIIB
MSSDKIKIKHGQECPNCHGTESEINAEGLSCCANCGLIEQQTKFDSNVVFGEQRDLQGKNINKQGNG